MIWNFSKKLKIKSPDGWIENFLQKWNNLNTLGDFKETKWCCTDADFEEFFMSSWKTWKNPRSYTFDSLVKYHIYFVTFFINSRFWVCSIISKIVPITKNLEKLYYGVVRTKKWCCTDSREFFTIKPNICAFLLHNGFHLAVKSKIKVSKTLILFSIYPLFFILRPFLIIVSRNRLSFL